MEGDCLRVELETTSIFHNGWSEREGGDGHNDGQTAVHRGGDGRNHQPLVRPQRPWSARKSCRLRGEVFAPSLKFWKACDHGECV